MSLSFLVQNNILLLQGIAGLFNLKTKIEIKTCHHTMLLNICLTCSHLHYVYVCQTIICGWQGVSGISTIASQEEILGSNHSLWVLQFSPKVLVTCMLV